ncbi:putative ATP-dependent helicase [Powai lake megavirus]|uniref:Putative ATP-dependent helicase n=1 Tax=Powai lake megavirus TaxID=1842663 RepID=A0A167RKL7_9VIRU|nr:putative ATP-dependent helicase [Powai lake megavirus]ANB50796.1 putative ATP-dependent helicase [Powai lake megavirus]
MYSKQIYKQTNLPDMKPTDTTSWRSPHPKHSNTKSIAITGYNKPKQYGYTMSKTYPSYNNFDKKTLVNEVKHDINFLQYDNTKNNNRRVSDIIQILEHNYPKIIISKPHSDNNDNLKTISTNDLYLELIKYRKYPTHLAVIMLDFNIEDKYCLLCFAMLANMITSNKTMVKLIIMTHNIDGMNNLIGSKWNDKIKYTRTKYLPVTIFDDKSQKYDCNNNERYVRAAQIINEYLEKRNKGHYVVVVPNSTMANIVKQNINYSDDINIIDEYKNLTFSNSNISISIVLTDKSYLLKYMHVDVIIDTLVANNKELSYQSKNNCVIIQHALKSNGIYVAMTNSDTYHKLPKYISPEINPKDIMNLISMMSNYNDILSWFNTNTVNETLKKLQLIGICNNDNNLTAMGKFCQKFPLEINNSVFIYRLNEKIQANIAIYICVLCTIQLYGSGLFIWPKKSNNEDVLCHTMRIDDMISWIENKYAGYSDVDTIFNIWTDAFKSCNLLSLFDMRRYCDINGLNFHLFKRIIHLVRDCIQANIDNNLGLNISFDNQNFIIPSKQDFSLTFFEILQQSHSDCEARVVHNFRVGKSHVYCGNEIFRIDNRCIHTMDTANDDQKIYYILSRNNYTANKGQDINVVNIMHSIPSINEDNSVDIFIETQLDQYDYV